MNLKATLLTALALISAPIASSAQLKNVNGNALVAKVKEANKGVSSIQCHFSRTNKVAVLKDAAKSEGTFYFQGPSNLSMKYADGELFVVTADNVSMSVGGKARTLKASNRHVEDLSETLLACVRGQVEAIDGSLKSAKEVGQTIAFKIDTDMKVGRNSITSIELTYAKSNCILNTLKLIEADGSYTLYDLKEKTLNKEIDKSVFTHASAKKRNK